MRRSVTPYIVAAGLIAVVAVAVIFASGLLAGPGGGLAGSAWQLTQLNGAPVRPAAKPLSLEFQQNGQLGGNSGCNSFGGKYNVSGSTLELTEMVSTLMACADQELNTQETAYVAALDAVATFERVGGQLTLRDAAGNPLLVFSAA